MRQEAGQEQVSAQKKEDEPGVRKNVRFLRLTCYRHIKPSYQVVLFHKLGESGEILANGWFHF